MRSSSLHGNNDLDPGTPLFDLAETAEVTTLVEEEPVDPDCSEPESWWGIRAALQDWQASIPELIAYPTPEAIAILRELLPLYLERFKAILVRLEALRFEDDYYTDSFEEAYSRLRTQFDLIHYWIAKSEPNLNELGIVMHEINQPLTAVKGGVDLLRQEIEDSVDEIPGIECPLSDPNQRAEAIEIDTAFQHLSTLQNFTRLIRRHAQIADEDHPAKERRSPMRRKMDGRERLTLPKGAIIVMIDDDLLVQALLGRIVEQAGGKPHHACDSASLDQILSRLSGQADIVILDNDLGGDLRGHQLIDAIRAHSPEATILVHTGDVDNAEAMAPYHEENLLLVEKGDLWLMNALIFEHFEAFQKPA